MLRRRARAANWTNVCVSLPVFKNRNLIKYNFFFLIKKETYYIIAYGFYSVLKGGKDHLLFISFTNEKKNLIV